LAVDALVARVRDATSGRVHALVHMAGGFAASGPVAESDPAVWTRQLTINLTTAYLTTRAFLPLLRTTKGAIVLFGSEAALPGARVAGIAAYAAAKSALLTLVQAIAQEEREHGVRANALAPAAIRTAANLATMGTDAAYVTREAVADVVLWLCSDAARAVTGQVVRVR
jgi:NAD(P)-dependent dehydrogenase (short-subunit alcohol dehydrogenase family)